LVDYSLRTCSYFSSKADYVKIAFDRRNMKEILEKANIPFPEEKRRKGFEKATYLMNDIK